MPLLHWTLTFLFVTQRAGATLKRLRNVSLGREWAAIYIATCQEPRYWTHPSISAYRKMVQRRQQRSAENVKSFTAGLKCRRILTRVACLVFPT